MADRSTIVNIIFEARSQCGNPQRLSDLAMKRSRDRNISFGEALSQLAHERPELTQPSSGAGAPGAAGWRFQSNDELLAEKAKARAGEKGISYSEALSQIVGEHPELTLPGSYFSSGEGSEPSRPLRRSERLNELARARQRERNCSFSEALSYTAERHPELTLPDYIITERS